MFKTRLIDVVPFLDANKVYTLIIADNFDKRIVYKDFSVNSLAFFGQFDVIQLYEINGVFKIIVSL